MLKSNMKQAESEFENKLQNLVEKSADSGEYTDHMQKLQVPIIILVGGCYISRLVGGCGDQINYYNVCRLDNHASL